MTNIAQRKILSRENLLRVSLAVAVLALVRQLTYVVGREGCNIPFVTEYLGQFQGKPIHLAEGMTADQFNVQAGNHSGPFYYTAPLVVNNNQYTEEDLAAADTFTSVHWLQELGEYALLEYDYARWELVIHKSQVAAIEPNQAFCIEEGDGESEYRVYRSLFSQALWEYEPGVLPPRREK